MPVPFSQFPDSQRPSSVSWSGLKDLLEEEFAPSDPDELALALLEDPEESFVSVEEQLNIMKNAKMEQVTVKIRAMVKFSTLNLDSSIRFHCNNSRTGIPWRLIKSGSLFLIPKNTK